VVGVVGDPLVANRMSGVVIDNNYRQELDLALRLHPDVNEVLVVASSPEGDKRTEREFRRQAEGLDRRVEFRYLTDDRHPLGAGRRHLHRRPGSAGRQARRGQAGTALRLTITVSPVVIRAPCAPPRRACTPCST
jgi:hypothetical protein